MKTMYRDLLRGIFVTINSLLDLDIADAEIEYKKDIDIIEDGPVILGYCMRKHQVIITVWEKTDEKC